MSDYKKIINRTVFFCTVVFWGIIVLISHSTMVQAQTLIKNSYYVVPMILNDNAYSSDESYIEAYDKNDASKYDYTKIDRYALVKVNDRGTYTVTIRIEEFDNTTLWISKENAFKDGLKNIGLGDFNVKDKPVYKELVNKNSKIISEVWRYKDIGSQYNNKYYQPQEMSIEYDSEDKSIGYITFEISNWSYVKI